MTVQELRNALKAEPFQQFNIRMADGRAFLVSHPEFVAISPSGRTTVVYQQDDSSSRLDLLLMTEIEWLPSTAKQP